MNDSKHKIIDERVKQEIGQEGLTPDDKFHSENKFSDTQKENETQQAINTEQTVDDNEILNDLDVGIINNLKIKEFLMNGREGEAALVMQNIINELGGNRFESLLLRHYISMHIYSSCRAFADSIGISKTEFEKSCGEPVVLSQHTKDIKTTVDYLTGLLEQCMEIRRSALGKTGSDAIKHAKEYILRNYADNELSLTSIAKASCISPAYLSSIFKKSEGMAFTDYLNKARVQKANELLILTSKNISEIAFEVGFNDSKYFSQLFRKYYGMLPKEYRQNKKSYYILNVQAKLDVGQLSQSAAEIRRNIIRSYAKKPDYTTDSLDATNILTTLYFYAMNIDPKNLHNEDRDRFVLSKGHNTTALYATLAERGYFSKDDLAAIEKLDSHPQGMNTTADIDMSAGSPGQGISAAASMALGLKLKGGTQRVYILLNDEEVAKNEAWEALLIAAQYHLDNLCVIINIDDLQTDGDTVYDTNIASLKNKLHGLGFYAIECDGNSIPELITAFDEAKAIQMQPSCILAKIIKNTNVAFVENNADWHSPR